MSATIYFVRHGEVEHHRADVGLTENGHAQAQRAADALAAGFRPGEPVAIAHAPTRRTYETAAAIHNRLAARFPLPPLQPDEALANVRFILHTNGSTRLAEPSLTYAHFAPGSAYLDSQPPARAAFFRQFWTSRDPMGFWLANPSAGGAELPEAVLHRLQARAREIFAAPAAGPSHHILVTHSGALRVLLRHAFGRDPGEPDFCGVVTLAAAAQPRRALLSYRHAAVEVEV